MRNMLNISSNKWPIIHQSLESDQDWTCLFYAGLSRNMSRAASASWLTDYNQALMMIAVPPWLFGPLQSSSINPDRPLIVLVNLNFSASHTSYQTISLQISFFFFWVRSLITSNHAGCHGNDAQVHQRQFSFLGMKMVKGIQQFACWCTDTDTQAQIPTAIHTSGHSGCKLLSWLVCLFVWVGWIIGVLAVRLCFLWHCLQSSGTWFKSCSPHVADVSYNLLTAFWVMLIQECDAVTRTTLNTSFTS